MNYLSVENCALAEDRRLFIVVLAELGP